MRSCTWACSSSVRNDEGGRLGLQLLLGHRFLFPLSSQEEQEQEFREPDWIGGTCACICSCSRRAVSTVLAASDATDAVTDEAFVAPSMRSRKWLSFVGEKVVTIEERMQAAAVLAVPSAVPEAQRCNSGAAVSPFPASSSSSFQAARSHASGLK